MGDYSESDLMGSDTKSDFKNMIARRDARKGQRDSEKNKKLIEYQEKEKEKMRKFKLAMGLPVD